MVRLYLSKNLFDPLHLPVLRSCVLTFVVSRWKLEDYIILTILALVTMTGSIHRIDRTDTTYNLVEYVELYCSS